MVDMTKIYSDDNKKIHHATMRPTELCCQLWECKKRRREGWTGAEEELQKSG